jgi:hypothetical protein
MGRLLRCSFQNRFNRLEVSFYNGGGGASYTPVGNLSGSIPEQLNGYGTVCTYYKVYKMVPRRTLH